MHRPHCYGLAACFNTKSCLACPVVDTCGPMVIRSLLEIADRVAVDSQLHTVRAVLAKRGVSVPLSSRFDLGHQPRFAVDRDLSSLSRHSQRIVAAILSRGIDMVQDARHNVNRMHHVRPSYLNPIQAHLNAHQQISKGELRAIIAADRQPCSPRSLNNHVYYASQVLRFLGLVEIGETYALP